MANEEKKPVAQAKGGAVKKTDKKPGFFNRVKKWFRDMKSELKKVVWPTKAEAGKNTLVALITMAVFAIVLWGFDTVAGAAVNVLIKLVG